MVKGLADKKSGFWMYLEKVVRPDLEKQMGRHLLGHELSEMGCTFWSNLPEDEKQQWKNKAKNFNNSEEGFQDKMRKRESHRQRMHVTGEPSISQVPINRAPKPSSIVPISRRFDEVDRRSKVYFSGVDDDFDGKRAADIDDIVTYLQWKFKEFDNSLEYFIKRELCIVTANVFCEYDEQIFPSELSLLKFSIERGITSQKNFVLGLTEPLATEDCVNAAYEHGEKTGIYINPRRMKEQPRTDFGGIWDELKAFTKVAEPRTKLLVHADCWNEVVGSFQTLFSKVDEKTFYRIETRFVTIEDFFLAMAMVALNLKGATNDLKSRVACGMRRKYREAIEFPLVTCPMHTELRANHEEQAVHCSLLLAHEAVFNFFHLSQDLIFTDYPFDDGMHFPVSRGKSSDANEFNGSSIGMHNPHSQHVIQPKSILRRPMVRRNADSLDNGSNERSGPRRTPNFDPLLFERNPGDAATTSFVPEETLCNFEDLTRPSPTTRGTLPATRFSQNFDPGSVNSFVDYGPDLHAPILNGEQRRELFSNSRSDAIYGHQTNNFPDPRLRNRYSPGPSSPTGCRGQNTEFGGASLRNPNISADVLSASYENVRVNSEPARQQNYSGGPYLRPATYRNPYSDPRVEATGTVPNGNLGPKQHLASSHGALGYASTAEPPFHRQQQKTFEELRNIDYVERNRNKAFVPICNHNPAARSSGEFVRNGLPDGPHFPAYRLPTRPEKSRQQPVATGLPDGSPNMGGFSPSSQPSLAGRGSPVNRPSDPDFYRDAVSQREHAVAAPQLSVDDRVETVFDVGNFLITYQHPKLEVHSVRPNNPDRRLELALETWCASGSYEGGSSRQ